MNTLISWAIIAGVIVATISVIALILMRLYNRASKEVSFVRTGMGGEHVVLNGGAFVLPVLHEIIPVNMNTLRLEVLRANNEALITKDRMRIDVKAEFYVRVSPTADSIATAAQTLGMKTMVPEELKELVEGKFVDALRAVAAEMEMEELHEKRVDFVQRVQKAVSEDLSKNGLELETVSLTGLDQTKFEYFNPQNAFDAEGLTHLTRKTEDRRKQRNDIEQDTDLQIKQKNLETQRARLNIEQEEEWANLEQQREIEVRRAQQKSTIAREQALKEREAEESKIAAQREIDIQKITAERDIKNQDIERDKAIEQAHIERQKTIELAEQERQIAVAEKSRDESIAKAEADKARALAVQEEENVATVREKEVAERAKAVQLIQASEDAEKERVAAKAQADAEMSLAKAAEYKYKVEAEGQEAVNEAANTLSQEQIDLQVRLALIKQFPSIISESVKPMENIEGIKILQVGNGAGNLTGVNSAGQGQLFSGASSNENLAESVVNSALKYRAQAPLIDSLLNEIGLADGGDLNKLTESLTNSRFSKANNPVKNPLGRDDNNHAPGNESGSDDSSENEFGRNDDNHPHNNDEGDSGSSEESSHQLEIESLDEGFDSSSADHRACLPINSNQHIKSDK